MRIAVVQGGPSAEAEVSRASAAGVASALAQAGHEVERLELSPALARQLLDGSFQAVFPVVHGRIGEDGCLQGLLEVLGMPYVGSGVLASAMAMDKIVAKRAFVEVGLPVAPHAVVRRDDDRAEAFGRVRAAAGAAVVVKPATEGSAIGVSRVHDALSDIELGAALDEALRYDDVALCERFVRGREITCGVVDAPVLGGLRALPVTEIFSKAADWYDFRSRYAAGGSVHACPADLHEPLISRVQQIAVQAHRALGCRDMSRVDFVVGDGDRPDVVTLLEVNAVPGMTATSLYPEAALAAGISFSALCDAFARGAVARAGSRRVVDPVPMP